MVVVTWAWPSIACTSESGNARTATEPKQWGRSWNRTRRKPPAFSAAFDFHTWPEDSVQERTERVVHDIGQAGDDFASHGEAGSLFIRWWATDDFNEASKRLFVVTGIGPLDFKHGTRAEKVSETTER